MGVVYLARDRRLDRLVAIKTLIPELAADPQVRQRFLRETRTAGGLAHPNIVPVHGADEIDGHVFYVMALVDGESLAAHIRARGPLPAADVTHLLRDVASGLAHAHGRGIVHRDIKCENILIDRANGSAMVTDFGIARLASAGPLTATGQLLGTVHYLSPEQVVGEAVDARSDLYSLGVVAYLALSGRFPFDNEIASAILVSHVTTVAPPLASVARNVPARLAAIVDRCLAKNPDARFESAEALLAALTTVSSPSVADVIAGRSASPVISTIVSNTEANAVWQRAAQLQAATGIQPRPTIIPRERDAARDQQRKDGIRLNEVRAAADEAGIDAQYVEHALAEHGLAPGASVMQRAPVRRSLWAGVPLDIVKEAVVPGEVSPRDFERFINVLRDGTGTLGLTTARSRELAWRGKWFGHRLEASIVPDKGVTTIRLSQSVRRMAVATLTATVVVGAAMAPLVGWMVSKLLHHPAPDWAIGFSRTSLDLLSVFAAVMTVPAVIPVGRKLLAWLRRRNDAELSVLTTLLAEKAREVVE